jgi:2-haloacid dehalogenase/putative hydrolase of the HAD superfamily
VGQAVFWVAYARGAKTIEEVTGILSRNSGVVYEKAAEFLRLSIDMQEPVKPTEELIYDLKAAGYKLYVLSNMSREFIDFLRVFPVYRLFDGEVVSCEEGVVKPEAEIYKILLTRFNLDPYKSLFIDDRQINLRAAEIFGIHTQLFDHKNPASTCDCLRKMLL